MGGSSGCCRGRPCRGVAAAWEGRSPACDRGPLLPPPLPWVALRLPDSLGPAPVGRQELEGVERVVWVGGMLALPGPLAVPLEPRLPLLPRALVAALSVLASPIPLPRGTSAWTVGVNVGVTIATGLITPCVVSVVMAVEGACPITARLTFAGGVVSGVAPPEDRGASTHTLFRGISDPSGRLVSAAG